MKARPASRPFPCTDEHLGGNNNKQRPLEHGDVTLSLCLSCLVFLLFSEMNVGNFSPGT